MTTQVPERPALAPDVRLIGEMQGTGFTDRQWLIQRDGHFIQVTELLYRVAERADGNQTLAQIAQGVTQATDWLVTPDQVRRLIQTKLVPMGLIATADGTIPSRDRETAQDRGRSALALSLRTKVLGPSVIEPIAKVLQGLYAPVVLVPVLLAIIVAHGWLYLAHGVGEGLRQTLYTPGLLLVVLAIMALAGVFHEFGHAAALRYGGGKVRGMGVGLYLVFPAFYTDVTDSYRLGRWARVRTDVGGFYFYLVFVLGVVGLYALTGYEFLLFVVVLINLDILRQLLPFVRLDGYWLLADLTGIPDFFSQIGPFLRSVLPISGEGTKLPKLKPWVKAVFAAYVVVTVPVLALLAFLLVRNVPWIVALLGDALRRQVTAFVGARENGDVPGMAAASAQMLILGLELLGVAFLLYKLTWRPVRGLWAWSKPTARRRLVGAITVGVAMALVAFLWVPHLPFGREAGPKGTERFEVTERSHVEAAVAYRQNPPVGGDHAPVWQNCGYYAAPVRKENAVHSLEHGAVWITYRPDLPQEQVDELRELAERQTYVLVSPYPGLPAPVVASAWGYQVRLDSVDDPRLGEFVRAFRLSSQAPERGAPCSEGIGEPA